MDNTDQLVNAISRMFRSGLEGGPREHPDRTEQCPSLYRFTEAGIGDWEAEELSHIADCSYCQKTVAMLFRAKCPSTADLVLYIAGQSPYESAVKGHLETDECQRCNLATRMMLLRKLADVQRARESSKAQWALLARSISMNASQVGFSANCGTEAAEPFFVRTEALEGRIQVIVRETGEGIVSLVVDNEDGSLVGRRIDVEVTGANGSFSAEIELQPCEPVGCIGHSDLGPAQEVIKRLEPSCAIVAVLAEA